MKVAEWPGAIPVGATTEVKDIIGRGVITAIFAKEPIIESRLAPEGRRRWNGRHDSAGNARRGRPRE